MDVLENLSKRAKPYSGNRDYYYFLVSDFKKYIRFVYDTEKNDIGMFPKLQKNITSCYVESALTCNKDFSHTNLLFAHLIIYSSFLHFHNKLRDSFNN